MEQLIETQAGPGTEVDDDLSPSGLLDALRERKATEDRAAADLLDLAARWADLHPPESIHHAATFTSGRGIGLEVEEQIAGEGDRKSTRLNSSHLVISYAVFCLKKKKTKKPSECMRT